jgi:hypothetical protein
MFNYHDSTIRQERLARGTDHCGSEGKVYALADLVKGGKVMDPRARSRPLTTDGTAGLPSDVLIYAVDADFNIHVGFDGVRGTPNAVKHETLFHNAEVRAAGELSLLDGIIVAVNDQSGSYRTFGRLSTDRRFTEAILMALNRSAAPVSEETRAWLREKAGRK